MDAQRSGCDITFKLRYASYQAEDATVPKEQMLPTREDAQGEAKFLRGVKVTCDRT